MTCFVFSLKLLESDLLQMIPSDSNSRPLFFPSAGWSGRPAQWDRGDGETAASGAQAAGHQEESAGVSL